MPKTKRQIEVATDVSQRLGVIQRELGSREDFPCTGARAKAGSCLRTAHEEPTRFSYSEEGAAYAARFLCPNCRALWHVAVARNLVDGRIG